MDAGRGTQGRSALGVMGKDWETQRGTDPDVSASAGLLTLHVRLCKREGPKVRPPRV